MKQYKLDILGLHEVRWNQLRELKTPSAMSFLYSGRLEEGGEHREGVMILLSAEAMECLLEWKPVSERMTARFQGRVHNASIIQ
jgi:hypothetical protein